jgi:hypothetical protein
VHHDARRRTRAVEAIANARREEVRSLQERHARRKAPLVGAVLSMARGLAAHASASPSGKA